VALPKLQSLKEYNKFVEQQLQRLEISVPLMHTDTYLALKNIDLSPVRDILKNQYSHLGTPAKAPEDMLRSLLTMTKCGFISIDQWVKAMRSFPFFAVISGFKPDNTPGVGTFYDFFDRLWMQDKNKSNPKRISKSKRKPRKQRKSKAHQKNSDNNNLPEKGVIQKLVWRLIKQNHLLPNSKKERKRLSKKFNKAIYSTHASDTYKQPDELLQQIFQTCFVQPSVKLGLINLDNLSVSGDGSKLATYANPRGKRLCKCPDRCDCPRLRTDAQARWGWDSYHERWIYGWAIHELVTADAHQLPIIVKLTSANIHDGVMGVELIREAITRGYKFNHAIFDSAYDNYPFYTLLTDYLQTIPVIQLNARAQGKFKNKQLIFLDNFGNPICLNGLYLANWGWVWQRGRNKWRCPICALKKHSVSSEICRYRDICQKQKSDYGRVFYTYPEENYRFFTPVPRESELWNKLYNSRSGSERAYKTKKIDYKLAALRTRGKKRWLIRTMIVSMCQHVDAQARAIGALENKSTPTYYVDTAMPSSKAG
jgi:transposase